jgi:hypothetical protein
MLLSNFELEFCTFFDHSGLKEWISVKIAEGFVSACGRLLFIRCFHSPDQGFKVSRFYLTARHRLFDRGQFKNDAENGSHRPVTEKSLIIENEILQLSPFDGHHNSQMNGIQWCYNPLGA